MNRPNSGESPDCPRLANLVEPTASTTIHTTQGPMVVDMRRLAQAADALGAGKHDVLGISGYRDARGQLVPDYESVKIERRACEDES